MWERTETPKVKDNSKSLQLRAIITADATLANDNLLNTVIRPCLADLDGSSIIYCVRNILNNRYQIPTFLDAAQANLSRLSKQAATTFVSILLDALDGSTLDPVTLSSADRKWVLVALSFVKNLMLTTRGHLVTVDTNGIASDIDTHISTALQKSLATDHQDITAETLSILSLRKTHHKVALMPSSLSDFIPRVIIASRFLLENGRRLQINPLSLTCVVIQLANQIPLEYLPQDMLRDYLNRAKEYFVQVHPNKGLTRYLKQCKEFALDLNGRVPGIANDLLEALRIMENPPQGL
ncbi:hypothetical protein ABKN59_004880 [Abortiporus biennis]